MIKRLFLSLVLALAFAPAPVMAQDAPDGPDDGPYAQITVIPEKNTIEAGETLPVAIHQELAPGWHTYWLNPGDSGEAMRIDWALPAGFSSGALEFPTPTRIFTGPLASYGYEGRATMIVPLTAPDELPAGPLPVALEVTVLVCEEICIPETSTHEFTLNLPNVPTAANAGVIEAARAAQPVAHSGEAIFAAADGQLVLRVADMAPPAGEALLIPYEWGLVENTADLSIETDGSTLILRQNRGGRPLAAIKNTRFLLVDEAGGRIITATAAPDGSVQAAGVQDIAAPHVQNVQNVPGAPDVPAAMSGSWPMALAFAFLGGLILNLMPCVFPVLSMKALSLCRISDKEEAEARIQALLYTAGIVLSFLAIAALLIGLRAGGAQIGWGFQLQNPLVIMVLAYLFFVIGLNLSGIFDISGRFSNLGQNLLAGGRHSRAFFMGVLATIVATPCTAPFMGVAMGYALLQGPVVALSVFAALGLGLAAPYVLLSYVPALRRLMPRPGHWMEVFRQFLAFPMYLSVAWLVWVYGQQAGSLGTIAILTGLVLVGFAIWLLRHKPLAPVKRALVVLLALLALAGAVALGHFRHTPEPAAATADETAYSMAYSPALLAELEEGDRPVFVNMTAAWCITCKVNERVALEVEATHTLFREENVAYLKGDWTNQDPAITAFLDRYGRNGVPLYVFYGPRETDGQRPEPVVLPQILTPTILRKTIKGYTE